MHPPGYSYIDEKIYKYTVYVNMRKHCVESPYQALTSHVPTCSKAPFNFTVPKPCTNVETRNTICIWVIWGGVGWGWGGGNNVHVNLKTHGLYGVHMGLGLGGGVGVITFMLT